MVIVPLSPIDAFMLFTSLLVKNNIYDFDIML